MSTDIIVPLDLWEEDQEGVITSWLVSNGARVETGELLAEVMVEKIQHEIESPAPGTLQITRKEDEVVNKGDVIATLSD
ncbi:MAG: biotin attachment protein [Gammaproteobacteria bacterium]|nr:MAG: biotin attachment protein [Gammaproteobacteria bacterium]